MSVKELQEVLRPNEDKLCEQSIDVVQGSCSDAIHALKLFLPDDFLFVKLERRLHSTAAAPHFRWTHTPPNPAAVLLRGRDLDWFKFCFFLLRQNDLQNAVFVFGGHLVPVDCCGQCERLLADVCLS